MNAFFICFLVALSLSMDAFSLALIYGTYGLSKRDSFLLSFMVGVFHFVMPLLGLLVGNVIMKYFLFDLDLMVGIIFLIIGIEMIISIFKNDDVKILVSFIGFLLFGLSVSIDSFTTGIGMSVITHNYIGVAFLFMIVSGLFTYLGLMFGNRLSDRFGKLATMGGGILMCFLSIYRLFR